MEHVSSYNPRLACIPCMDRELSMGHGLGQKPHLRLVTNREDLFDILYSTTP